MGAILADFQARGVFIIDFGDLFLEDLRPWREANLARAEMTGVFPIWGRESRALAREAVARGFCAILSCVEGKVGPGFAGRPCDEDLLADLPVGIDPCGEHGEFHTFVHDGPCFARPVPVAVDETVVRDGRYYADLLPAGRPSAVSCLAGDNSPGVNPGRSTRPRS